jgi:hypothetical protein
MGKRRTIEDRETVSCAISKAQLDWVRHMARQMGAKRDRNVSLSEAIRMAVETVYPMPKKPKQLDLFSEKQ